MVSGEVKNNEAHEAELEQVRKIVRDHPVAKANLALLGDKKFLFNEMQSSFVMYGVQGRSWIVLGDPIGPSEEAPALIRRFHQTSIERGARPVFYEVSNEYLFLYEDLGLHPLKVRRGLGATSVFLPGGPRAARSAKRGA